MRVDADYINIAMDRVFIQYEFRMILARPELDVVTREVPPRLEVIIDDLFQHVFLQVNRCGLTASS